MLAPTFTVNLQEQTSNYGLFTIEPLPQGFGHTLGNTLRRILLSNLKGAALTKVKIAGVKHKFSTLEGMSEDIIDLLLNLKQVKLAYDQDEPAIAKLDIKGPKVVKAKDIKFPSSVRLVNPDHVLANLAKGAHLSLEVQIETGYGYSPATDRQTDVIGEIPLEALFSPVERVAYSVQQTRVGRRTDFDQLILKIFTDGSQSPHQVLQEAARIAVAYFQQIYQPRQIEDVKVDSPSSTNTPSEHALTIEELGIPTRIANALAKGGYHTLGDLTQATLTDLKNIKNLGSKSLQVIQDILADKGFHLKSEA